MDFQQIEKDAHYTVYTRIYDETVHIDDLCDETRSECLKEIEATRQSDLNEVTNSFDALLERLDPDTAADTTVTFLVDNSGSMRGTDIMETAISVLAMAESLDKAGIHTEILGYTTKSWKGGQTRTDWHAAGRNRNPGRLAELRHIIYKDADTPFAEARADIAAMLTTGIHKENIDNEALAWAYGRIESNPRERKVLVFLPTASNQSATHRYPAMTTLSRPITRQW